MRTDRSESPDVSLRASLPAWTPRRCSCDPQGENKARFESTKAQGKAVKAQKARFESQKAAFARGLTCRPSALAAAATEAAEVAPAEWAAIIPGKSTGSRYGSEVFSEPLRCDSTRGGSIGL